MNFEDYLKTVNLYSSKPLGDATPSCLLFSKSLIDAAKNVERNTNTRSSKGDTPKKRKTSSKKCKMTLIASHYTNDQWLASEIAGTLKKNRVVPLSVCIAHWKETKLDRSSRKASLAKVFGRICGKNEMLSLG